MVVIGHGVAVNLDNVLEWDVCRAKSSPEGKPAIRFTYGLFVTLDMPSTHYSELRFETMEDAKREFIAISRALTNGLAVYVIDSSVTDREVSDER